MADLDTIKSDALFGQDKRLLKLTTPLGENMLLPQRVIAHARLGRSYEYTMDCLSGQEHIELKQLIAQGVTLWIRQLDESYEPVHGYVHTIKRLGSDGELMSCQLTLAPWLHFLKFRRDARIWQDKTVHDILSDVFRQHPQAQGNFRFDIREPARSRSYCTQYETDWHFVQRLMEEEGWYGYHEQLADGSGHVLVITDSTYQLPPIAQQHIEFHGAGTTDEVNRIVHWSAERTLLSTTSRIEIHAKDEVMISAGGSFIKIDASGISNGTSGAWIAHASTHSMPGPARQPYVMPHVLKPELQTNELEFRHLTDWGEPLAGAAYKATLSDGSVRTGILDALGVARISGLPQGVGAKIEYDYQPLPASSTVASELHQDVHELLNWTPRNAMEEGTA